MTGRAAAVAAALTACSSRAPAPPAPGDEPRALVLPRAGARFDYQLGGAYPPPPGVEVVVRDRTAAPAAGVYNICYVNGFQVQPGEEAGWQAREPDLILRDGAGAPVIDADWNELLLDVRTAPRRARVAAIVGAWIDGCAAAGFDAIEIDNLDAFSRSGGLLGEADAIAAMRLFADAAHARGLPIAQKNAAELAARRADLGTDFAIVEECNRYTECEAYLAAYATAVLMIEYRREDLDAGCAAFPAASLVLRDRDLVAAGAPGHVFAGC